MSNSIIGSVVIYRLKIFKDQIAEENICEYGVTENYTRNDLIIRNIPGILFFY